MPKKSLFFNKDVIKEYFNGGKEEREKHFQELLRRRELSEEVSENLLTINSFIALNESGLLNEFLKKIIKKELKDPKIHFEEAYPCSKKYLDEIKKYFKENPHYDLKIRRKGAPKEGTSKIDVVIEDDENLIFIEVKYLSDISSKTTFDFARNQIIRNIDVLVENSKDKTPYFILITPAIFKNDEYAKHSKLYFYKMNEYTDPKGAIDAMRRDSWLEKEKLKNIQGKIFWATFEEDILPLLVKNNAVKGIKSYLKMIFVKENRKLKEVVN
jgi:hypothetical protein